MGFISKGVHACLHHADEISSSSPLFRGAPLQSLLYTIVYTNESYSIVFCVYQCFRVDSRQSDGNCIVLFFSLSGSIIYTLRECETFLFCFCSEYLPDRHKRYIFQQAYSANLPFSSKGIRKCAYNTLCCMQTLTQAEGFRKPRTVAVHRWKRLRLFYYCMHCTNTMRCIWNWHSANASQFNGR